MVEQVSPLLPVWKPGSHGNFADGVGATLTETRPGSIVQVGAWPGREPKLMEAIEAVAGLTLPDGAGGGVAEATKAAFGIAPCKFLVIDQAEGLGPRLTAAVTAEIGTVTDLSHGRTAMRISGPKAEWVLSKLFAVDFALAAFAVGAGRSTAHHDVFAQIQRTDEAQFDLYVFRSFARSFWTVLCHAAEEVGYEVR